MALSGPEARPGPARAEYDGDPAPASDYYLNELLRKEWGFEGSDIIDMGRQRPWSPDIVFSFRTSESAMMSLVMRSM